jgi:membrane protease YdiL (CAAX protease family)
MFRPGLRTWSAFALATGVLLGGLRLATGGILAAVVAHSLVDAVNLPLVRRAGRLADR